MASRPYTSVTGPEPYFDQVMRRRYGPKGGHGADGKNFLDGIPKGAFFLAGFIAQDLLAKRRRRT